MGVTPPKPKGFAMNYVVKAVSAIALAATALPSAAIGNDCAQQWSKVSDFLVEFTDVNKMPPVLSRTMSDGACRVSGIEFPFDRRSRMAIRSITWNGEDLERFTDEGLPPRSLNIAIDDMRRKSDFGFPDVDEAWDEMFAEASADINIVAHWDEETSKLYLDLFSIRLATGDYLTVEAVADNVDFSSKGRMQMSATGWSISTMTVGFETLGAFEQVLEDPFGSDLWGRSQDRTERVATMEANVDLLPDALVPQASKTAIKSFFKDTPSPKGPVRIDLTASPGLGPVRFLPFFSGLHRQGDKETFWSMLEGIRIDVSYPQ
jgi:hypothetical protein